MHELSALKDALCGKTALLLSTYKGSKQLTKWILKEDLYITLAK